MATFEAHLGRWLPNSARVLEVGAGSGALARRLGDAGHDVVAIDPDPSPGSGVQPMPVEQFTTDRPFDAVVCQRALHHVDDLEQALEAITAALVEDGTLLLHEFCWDLLDEPTGGWLHQQSRRLGLDVAADPAEFTGRWRTEHQHLATFAHLRAQLNRRFHELDFAWTPCLADDYLHSDPEAKRSEARHLHEGSISPVAFLYAGRNEAATNR